MRKARLYLKLGQDDTVNPIVEEDKSAAKIAACSWSRVPEFGRLIDPDLESMGQEERQSWSSGQRWLSQKRPELKRIICEQWDYCAKRTSYGNDVERLVQDISTQIQPVVGENLADIVAVLLYKEGLFSLCECGDLKKLMDEARVAFRQRRFDDNTLRLFARIIEHDPDNHWAHWCQGVIYDSRCLYEKSLPHYEKAIAIMPSEARYLNNLGYVYVNLKRNLDTAQEYISLALHMSMNYPYGKAVCLDSYGWLLFKRGKFEDALKYILDSSEMVRPKKGEWGIDLLQETLYHLAFVNRELNNKDKCQETVNEIKMLNSSSIWSKKAEKLLNNRDEVTG